ncbi:GNAT family N-acetyltransferase [Oryzisolibacter sp. LB2S]|uniref:GNAT family N-acetyltransferase n=1 Tax=Alicycliphilus soli TaxID=3228789 RepID=UPI00345B00D7
MNIRPYAPADAPALRQVFESSVRELAARFYTPEQIDTWAPREHDAPAWARRLADNRPWVCEVDGRIAGFADLQPSGHIDQFFVAPQHARRGVGAALLAHLERQARRQGCAAMRSHVSLAAQAFFARHGFVVQERRVVTLRGVQFANALMRKELGRDGGDGQ